MKRQTMGLLLGIAGSIGAARAQTGPDGVVDVRVLAFNDFHGNLKPPTGSGGRIYTEAGPVDAGGVEYLATHLARQMRPHTAIVAAGDLVGGSPLLSALFHDEPSIEALSLAGLQIAAVGNHEFDEGWTELLRLQNGGCHPQDGCQDGDDFKGAGFRYLAANVIVKATGKTLLPSHEVREYDGVKVAFIGLTLEGTPAVTVKSGVEGLKFLDEVKTINAQVATLKAQGIQAFVVLMHEGGLPTGRYNECKGISGPLVEIVKGLDPAVDVVVTGHTHAAYNCLIANKIVTSAAHAGRVITAIDLRLSKESGDVLCKSAENLIVTRDVPPDGAQTALIQRYDQHAAVIANRVIGQVAGDLTRNANGAGESTMGAVVADAQLDATRAQGAVVAFMNPGGLRADVLAKDAAGGEAEGEITYGEAFAVQPFNNLLVTMSLSGAQLDSLLEQQWQGEPSLLIASAGFTYRMDPARPAGDRVDNIRIDGVAVTPAKRYRVTVNSFLAEGGDRFHVLIKGTQRVVGGVDVDALAGWLAKNRPLPVPVLPRVSAP